MRRLLAATIVLTTIALASLGHADSGNGGPAQDPDKNAAALRVYRTLAKIGNADAQNALGNVYDSGDRVPQDHRQAVKWYRLAAEQGHPQAQSNLGMKYELGQGVPQSYIRAHKWFSLSAAGGFELATNGHDIVAKHMTPDQIAEAQRLAAEWTAKREKSE